MRREDIERARREALATGRTVKVTSLHDDPCVCGPYDRCNGVRAEDARRAPTRNAAIRARHRAYND